MKKILKTFLRQFQDFTIILLIICAAVSGGAQLLSGAGFCTDSLIILTILILNALFGTVQELKAEEIIGDTQDERPTHMQRRLSEVGRLLCALTGAFCIIIFLGGILRGGGLGDMLLLSLSLAVAVIPESLPAIVTIMLSSGICCLSREDIYVRSLICTEALGQIKAVFLNPDNIGNKEKAQLEETGIKIIDKADEKTFYNMWSEGEIICFIGEAEADRRFMAAADVGGCLSSRPELYNASHIVFNDLNSLPRAVKTGRVIYGNLKKSLHFLLSCNIGELLCIFAAVAAGLELPLPAVQLLMVNLITDCFPAIAMALEPPDEDIMKRSPVEETNFIDRPFIIKIIFEGIVISAVTLAAFIFGKTLSGLTVGRTMAFAVLCISQLFHGFNMRGKELFKNKFLNLSFILGFLIVVLAAELPLASRIFGLVSLDPKLWFDVILLSFLPFVLFKAVEVCRKNIL